MAYNEREPLSIVVFSASLRRGSLNTALAALVAEALDAPGVTVERTSMRESQPLPTTATSRA